MELASGLEARHGSPRNNPSSGLKLTVKSKAWALVGTALATALVAGSAQAETLADAIALAYQTNPSLKMQREQLKALDEQFVQASQNLRPQVSFQGVINRTDDSTPKNIVTTSTLGLSASQVLTSFGKTSSQISVAEAEILAGRETLRQAEGDTIYNVIAAYAAVRRDETGVDISRQAVTAFQAQVDQARERLKAGDSTLTDIGQAESQLASTQAALVQAQAQLQVSRATYALLVGQNPGTLAPIPPLPNMPASVDAAYDAAEGDSPVILQAVMNEKAGRANVQEAKSQYRPTLSASAQYAYTGFQPFITPNIDRETIFGLSLNVPIINGGYLRSKVREAEANDRAAVSSIEVARRQVVDTVSNNWNQIVSAEQQYTLGQQAVSAAKTSSEGAKLEYDEGFRAFFEVLNEQQRLLDAQLLVNQTEYNRVVGQAAVLNAIGELDVDKIISGVPTYDPKKSFDRVHNKGGIPFLDPVLKTVDAVTGPAMPKVPNVASTPVTGPVAIPAAPETKVSGGGFTTAVPTEANDGDVLGKLIDQAKAQ